MSDQPAIAFRGVSKRYFIQQRETPRLGAWVANKLFEHFRREEFRALDDVSFTVTRGEMVGLVGANGAGKSTVLKLIAGITPPDAGSVEVHGRVTSMLELGVGFHPELSGMENIFYNASLMGMTRAETLVNLASIIEFSGLAAFLHEPVKHYSSGMYARLACSVAMHLRPEIILVDEILAVGDAEFQQRGMTRILELHEQGVTIVLVTHEVATARDLCDRLLWLDRGSLVRGGAPREVFDSYMRFMADRALPRAHWLSDHAAPETAPGRPRIARINLFANGEETREVPTGAEVRIDIDIEGLDADTGARLALVLRWPDGTTLFEDATTIRGSQVASYAVANWPILRGPMMLSCGLTSPDGARLHDRAEDAVAFETLTDHMPMSGVVVAPPVKWTMTAG